MTSGMTSSMTSNTPEVINIHRKSASLELGYQDGTTYHLSAEYLRVFSPSAEVQGHSAGQSVLQDGKAAVQFQDVEPQGHYAIRISFSDGHDSGIYTWNYLRQLAEDYEQNWQAYLERLKAAGKQRQSQFIALG